MDIAEQIEGYIASQPAAKRDDLRELHRLVLAVSPDCRFWFLDGRNADGKIVSNPNIGYGVQALAYADGTTRDFYRIGISANTGGISIYVIGIDDKDALKSGFGTRLGKASITGYCIKFKKLGDLDRGVLEEVIRFGFDAPRG